MPKRLWLFALLVASLACGRGSGEPTAEEIQRALGERLERAGTASFPSRKAIRDFYAKRGNRPIWTDASDAASLIGTLKRAHEDGLDPRDYAVDRLEVMQREMREQPKGMKAAQRIADFDLVATIALFRFASDLATGRVHPGEIESDWHTKPPEVNVARVLAKAVERRDLAGALATLRPPQPGYARLRDALTKLREEASRGPWQAVPRGPKLERGSHGARVALLRRRLDAGRGSRFDLALDGRVRRFQRLHGIEPDGIVGAAALDAMNVPIDERIRQVELNLERWRWVPRRLGDPHVRVNIAGFELELERQEAVQWRTRVVAGKAFTPTPVLSDRIVAVVVNPRWSVPESIAVNEYLPELQKNPKALAKERLHVIQGAGDKERELDPAQIDWAKIDPDHFPYTFRQDPGGKNPLGRLKFDLTNGYQIDLHDTPGGAAFGRADRGRSHGCIRIEHAQDFAAQIADGEDYEKIAEALGQGEERRIELKKRVPVHIIYWTAWVDEVGSLHFAPDVYGFDPPQLAALRKVSESAGSGSIARASYP